MPGSVSNRPRSRSCARPAVLEGPHPLLTPAALDDPVCGQIYRALQQRFGLLDDMVAVLWCMYDRFDPDSAFAPYWAALPPAFHTGLTFAPAAVALLKGNPYYAAVSRELEGNISGERCGARAVSPVHVGVCTPRELVRKAAPLQASCVLLPTPLPHHPKQSQCRALQLEEKRALLRDSYDKAVPALTQLVPELFPKDRFGFDQYVWMSELWHCYCFEVKLAEGRTREALLPLVDLMNHSPYPHIAR